MAARRRRACRDGGLNLSRRLLLAGLACPGLSWAALPAHASALQLRIRALSLSNEDPALDRLGPLRFRGALALASPDRRFGGLSGVLLDPSGAMLAVTDQASWFAARLVRDEAGMLINLAEPELLPMRGVNGAPLAPGRQGDAEALARLPDGRLLVAFERWHRLRAYAGPEAPGQYFPNPRAIATLPSNAGLESVTALADGRILAIAEAPGEDGTCPAWLGTSDGRAWEPHRYRPTPEYVPVDAAGLPGGGALVLERRVSLLMGFTSTIVWLPAESLSAPVLEPRPVAAIAPPLTSDNYEGIAVALRADGLLDVLLVSDDNFSMFQRNIMMLFTLDPADLA